MFSLEIVGNNIRFALTTAEVSPDLIHQLHLITRALTAQAVAFDILIEQLIRIDLEAIAGKIN